MTLCALYELLDQEIEERTRSAVGFTNLLAARPYPMDEATFAGYRTRSALINEFQRVTIEVFAASLRGDADPQIAATVLSELPDCHGAEFHRSLSLEKLRPPVFFRTDEGSPGKIVEIQCCGSAWGLQSLLQTTYTRHSDLFTGHRRFSRPIAAAFAESLAAHLGERPIIHHLVENASLPHDALYFIQCCRSQGLLFYSWDRGVTAYDCNFVRSHDFFQLRYQNNFSRWLEVWSAGRLLFDLPPSPLFDGKSILSWPFWEKTRAYYRDEIRDLFPYTSLVEADRVQLAEDEAMTVDDFSRLPRSRRNAYLKYGGSDVAMSWGSKGVYYVGGSTSRAACRELFDRVLADAAVGRRWILQQACRRDEWIDFLSPETGEMRGATAYVKLSGFYGPGGLLGILVMHRNSSKVHGARDTIVSIVP